MSRSVLSLVLVAALVLIATPRGVAFDLTIGASANGSTETKNALYPEGSFRIEHKSAGFEFVWDMEAIADGAYGGFLGGAFGYGGVSMLVREGGLAWSGGGLSLAAGRFVLKDELDSPYSLFVSSKGNSALTAKIRYEDERFFFSDSWIALNYDLSGTYDTTVGNPSTASPWPDRSAVIKNYGVKFGDLRIGFQDATIYTDKNYYSKQRGPLFDAEYFLNPAPGFFLQYIGISEDSPWKKDKGLDDNSILGFFAELKRERATYRGQIMVDDINLRRFLDPSGFMNPDKIAWTLGATLDTEYGIVSFDHAGATQFAFEPYGRDSENRMYGYSFYPTTAYQVDGDTRYLSPEAAYLGYLHGENNIAFMTSWKNRYGDFSPCASFELTLSGPKSPTNPWGLATTARGTGGDTRLLGGKVETKAVLTAGSDYRMGDITLYARVGAGYVFNELKVSYYDASNYINGMPIYTPSNEGRPIASLSLGGKWTLKY